MKSVRHMKRTKRSCAVADFTLAKIHSIVSATMHLVQADIVKSK